MIQWKTIQCYKEPNTDTWYIDIPKNVCANKRS